MFTDCIVQCFRWLLGLWYAVVKMFLVVAVALLLQSCLFPVRCDDADVLNAEFWQTFLALRLNELFEVAGDDLDLGHIEE